MRGSLERLALRGEWRRRLDWRNKSICIWTVLRCLSLRASLAKRLEKGRRQIVSQAQKRHLRGFLPALSRQPASRGSDPEHRLRLAYLPLHPWGRPWEQAREHTRLRSACVPEHAVFVERCRLAAGMIDPSPELPLSSLPSGETEKRRFGDGAEGPDSRLDRATEELGDRAQISRGKAKIVDFADGLETAIMPGHLVPLEPWDGGRHAAPSYRLLISPLEVALIQRPSLLMSLLLLPFYSRIPGSVSFLRFIQADCLGWPLLPGCAVSPSKVTACGFVADRADLAARRRPSYGLRFQTLHRSGV
ncbi:hypothetical protein KCU62_g147, partial [Aureobasidium sp. EXF-3399]